MTRIHTLLWGDSVLAVRLLPALIGVTSLFLVGWLIKQLKGGSMAQVIGLTAGECGIKGFYFRTTLHAPALLFQCGSGD